MTTFVLVPGAGGDSWHWHRVLPLLTQAGHRAVAVDLPGEDPGAGLPEYTQLVVDAAPADDDDVVLVAQSLGGFTAPLAAAHRQLRALVLVNAMIPAPGETPGDWWGNTGAEQARTNAAERHGYPTELDPAVHFLHDVPPEVLATGDPNPRGEADAVFASPCDFTRWPAVPLHVASGADDRFFPADFQRRVAEERLHTTPDVLPGGHLLALARPAELARYLLAV